MFTAEAAELGHFEPLGRLLLVLRRAVVACRLYYNKTVQNEYRVIQRFTVLYE